MFTLSDRPGGVDYYAINLALSLAKIIHEGRIYLINADLSNFYLTLITEERKIITLHAPSPHLSNIVAERILKTSTILSFYELSCARATYHSSIAPQML
jgi:hypothetical protein